MFAALYRPALTHQLRPTSGSMEVTKNDVTVVLPVLNEEASVTLVIDELVENGYRNILVVDGYSTDMTAQGAQRSQVTVVPQHGKGKAGAIRTAIDHVSTPYMLVMDGDYTYAAADIEKFLRHAGGYDEIVGVRQSEYISGLHRLGNRFISRAFSILMHTELSDVCSGMYLLNSMSARQLELRSTGFSVEVEVLAQMALGGRVTEVPIDYRKRIGRSKLSTWKHGFGILKSVVDFAWHYNPIPFFATLAATVGIPGLAILGWVLWAWMNSHTFNLAWAITGGALVLISSQSLVVATIATLMKRVEIRIERVVRDERTSLESAAATE